MSTQGLLIPPPEVKPMVRGYARVSTPDQNLDLQIDALKRHGVQKIYQDKISGSKTSRPALDKLLLDLNPGDTVVVWRLDRLGRSVMHLLELASGWRTREINIVAINEGIDTRTPTGRLVYGILSILAENEREVIKERAEAGLKAAKARGVVLGPPRKLTEDKMRAARVLLEGDMMLKRVAQTLGVDRSTLYRALEAEKKGSGRKGKC